MTSPERIEILINAAPGETRLALVEDGRLVEFVVSRVGSQSQLGAIYLGRVATVSKALHSAFVDLGLDRPGMLAFADAKPGAPKLSEGAPVVVQVTRDATIDKGAKLTAKVERTMPSDVKAPVLLDAAPDPVTQFLAQRARPGWRIVADHPRAGVEQHRARTPIFAEHDIDAQIEAALQPVVPLGDGAFVSIEETAALAAIDVNTGPRGAPHAVNLTAATEIARQIRLRNLGGQILIDFLPEKGRERREQLVAALRAAVASDPNGVHVLGLTRLGLAELTRRRIGESLAVQLGFENVAVRSHETAALDLLRAVDEQSKASGTRKFAPAVSGAIAQVLNIRFRSVLDDMIRRHALQWDMRIDDALAPGDFRL